jgi:hypothetical protein
MWPDISRLVARIHDAGLAPDAWPDALESLTDALGGQGAACIVSNRRTGNADWVCFTGLSAEFQSDYIDHYGPLDPFKPLLDVGLGWTKLSECLPRSLLRKSEWYNDFVLACGVHDILGAHLVDTPSHSAFFGLHQQIGRRFDRRAASILDRVTGPLRSATLRHVERLVGPAWGGTDTPVPADGARYFFHVSNGRRYPDETGRVFSTRQEAIAHASVLAAELGQDEDWGSFAISVTDADGNLIARIPVANS